jgi:hypothetical protein
MKIARLNGITNIDHLFDTGIEPQWNKDRRSIIAVGDDYNFSGATDITSMENWVKYEKIFKQDYTWLQRRIEELRVSIGWTGLTNTEKDLVIYYNQMKTTSSGDTESALKVTHLLTTGQVPDVPTATAFLRKTHSESIVRSRPGIIARVDGSKLIETIIGYLNREDTSQLLNTVQTHMSRYKEFAMIGTIIYGEEEGLRDYIESTGPTYSGNGLVEEGWATLNGKTLSDLRDDLINILFEDNDI